MNVLAGLQGAFQRFLKYRPLQFSLKILTIWLITLFSFHQDYLGSFHWRFLTRPPQPVDPRIVLISIEADKLKNILSSTTTSHPFRSPQVRKFHPMGLEKILSRLLIDDPAVIGINFFIDKNFALPSKRLFTEIYNQKVIWASYWNPQSSKINPSLFTRPDFQNTGLHDISKAKGVMQDFYKLPDTFLPSFPEKIYSVVKSSSTKRMNSQTPYRINYRGTNNSFPEINFEDILSGHFPPGTFKDKIVIIGLKQHPLTDKLTPIGNISDLRFQAHLIDNFLNNRWIKSPVFQIIAFYSLLICLLAAIILLIYPLALGLTLTVFLGSLLTVASFYLFDVQNYWVPTRSLWICLILSYMVWMNYIASRKEKSLWNAEIEQKNTKELEMLKNNFLSLFSHDLKTPISNILAITDRIRLTHTSHDENDDLKTGLQKIKKSGQELHKQIHQILQVIRVEAKDFKIEKRPCDLNQILASTVDSLSSLAQESNVDIQTRLEPLFSVDADPHLMKEVFSNLIENAIKFSPPQSQILITSQEKANYLEICFQNHGPQISDENIEKLFEPFFTKKQVEKNHFKSSGLGLYLVKYFIHLHHGFLNVMSEPDKTKFTVQIPLEPNLPGNML